MSDCFCLAPSETAPTTDADATVIDHAESRDPVCMAHGCSIPRRAKAACRDAKHCVVAMQGDGVGVQVWFWPRPGPGRRQRATNGQSSRAELGATALGKQSKTQSEF